MWLILMRTGLRSSKKMQRVVDPAGMLVMDAKSLYDAMQSEQASQDNARAALHAAMTKETAKDFHRVGAAASRDQVRTIDARASGSPTSCARPPSTKTCSKYH